MTIGRFVTSDNHAVVEHYEHGLVAVTTTAMQAYAACKVLRAEPDGRCYFERRDLSRRRPDIWKFEGFMRELIGFEIKHDDDGSCQLCMELQSGLYAGRGSAYFDPRFLLEKAKEMAVYPLPEHGVEFFGGYLDANDLTKLRWRHVDLSVRSTGFLGEIGLRAAVAEPSDDGKTIRSYTFVEIATDYAQLSTLAEGLVALVEGRDDSFAMEFNTGRGRQGRVY